MNDLKERILFNLLRAWRRLFVFTPQKWSEAVAGGQPDNVLTLAAFPVIGFVIAWLAIWFFAILGVLITQPASAVLFGLFMTGLMIWKDRGRALMVFCSITGALASGVKLGDILDQNKSIKHEIVGFGSVVMALVSAVQFFVFWSCFRDGASGLAAFFVIVYFSSQGYFATKGGLNVSSDQLGGVGILILMLLLLTFVATPFVPALFMLLAAVVVMASVAALSRLLPMNETLWQCASGLEQLLLLLVMFVAVLA